MAVKKLNKTNCCFLYGEDLVSISLRKDALLQAYFHNNPPEVTEFDGQGNYEAYQNALEGQSLFSSATAVMIHNPPFLKRISKSSKEDPAQVSFLNTLENLPPDIFCLILLDGKADSRTKIVKSLLSICYSEKLDLLKSSDAAEMMIHMLQQAGKRVDFAGRNYMEMVLSSWDTVSLPLLQTECDKIVLMCGNESVVTKHILELALPDYMNQGVFKFINVLLDKKASAVLASADRVFTDTSTTIKNLGALSAKFRQIKMLKEMERNRVPVLRMQQMLHISKAWQWKYLVADARKVTEDEVEWFLLKIFQYQFYSRQGNSEAELKDLLLQYCMK